MNAFYLKPDMLLGVVSSATQADGGDLCHSWNDWYDRGRIKDGSNPALAADHWNHWKEDVLLMRQMGVQTCRLGIEWARIEPQEGVFDESAIGHIKEELMLMIGMGIRPLVTLHHFTNPMWFECKGGWEKYENICCFLIYVERVVKSIGHLVGEYITVDEPNVYAFNGWQRGIWPPGKKSAAGAMNVLSNLAAAHIRAYRLIHDIRWGMGFQDTKVAFANEFRVFIPKNHLNPAHLAAAAAAERVFQKLPTKAMLTGEFERPLHNNGRARPGVYCDFHAVNYYKRSAVTGSSDGAQDSCYKNDLGWEIYPAGLIAVCKKLTELKELPIYITGNGTCDLNDGFRCRYIYDHLKVLCGSGLPVKRYYHRSFCDGFEWLEGNYARFGLVHMHFDTMERTIKSSGEFFGEIIRRGGVTEELYSRYVEGRDYHF